MASLNDLLKNFMNSGKELVKGVANETQKTFKNGLTDIFINKPEEKQQSYVIDSSNKTVITDDSYDLEAKLQEIINNYKNSN